jgi:hypothetical protein
LLYLAGRVQGPADYQAVLDDLYVQLNRFTFLAYLNSLSANNRKRLERMIANERPLLELEQFVHDHVPDMPQVHAKALRSFRRIYLRQVKTTQRDEPVPNNSD